MRVLISAYSCEPGEGSEPGAGYAIVRAASMLAECWVLTRSNNLRALGEALDSDPPPNPVHLIPVDASSAVVRLKRRFRAFRPYYALWQRLAAKRAAELDVEIGGFDVVHHATVSTCWLPFGVARLSRPFVAGPISGGTSTPRSLIPYLGFRGALYDLARMAVVRFGARAQRSAWRAARVLIAQNEQMRRYAERHLVVGNTRLMTHSHASNPSLDHVVATGSRRPEVLFVGRLVTWKGVYLACEVFRRVQVPEARLVFIGTGPARRALERRVQRLGLSDRVVFEGSKPRVEVLARMRRASCLLFPSFHDSAGFVVSEALSLGLPVVCLDHGGPGTLVRLWPQVPHEAVRPADRAGTVASLATAVERFLRSPAPIPPDPESAQISLSSILEQAYRWAMASSGVDGSTRDSTGS